MQREDAGGGDDYSADGCYKKKRKLLLLYTHRFL